MRLQRIDWLHMEFLVFGEDFLVLLVLGSASGVRALPMIQVATGRAVHEHVYAVTWLNWSSRCAQGAHRLP